ncbi:MAG TPA: hypothetical protein EYP43_03915, partial [Thermoplasmata archaeon]|nr:hypothetical protein [Thermoplasmata archaeon]
MRRGGGPRGLVLYVAAFLVLATLCLLSVNARAAYNVTIDSPSEDDIVEGVVVINGSLSHEGSPEPDAVSVRINGTWRDAVDVNGGGGNWTSWLFTWRSGTVPNGPIRIDVAARDGFNYLGMVSVNVTVNNTPPVVAITKATPATVVVGSFVTLEGEVLSVGSGSTITQYRWVSDIDSHIGNVANTTCFLSVGNHTIRFRAMNDIGTWSDPVAVNVLVTPVDSLRLPGGDLTLSGYDPEDIDVADIERGWFFATGARDALGNLVPYTGQIITAIIHVNGILYVTLENGTILALDGAGLADEAQGRMVDSADVLWSTHLGRVTTGSLVYHDGVLFVGTEDGYVYALDALTGKADVWPVEGSFQWVGDESISGNALTVIQGFLVFGSYDEVAGQGNVWVLDIEDGSIV